MADARQDQLPSQVRNVTLHCLDFFTPEAEDSIAVTRDKEGRLTQLGSIEEGRKGPVTIDIAIVIEQASKTAALEFANEELDIGVGHEGRLLGRRGYPKAPRLFRIHSELPALLFRRFTRRRVEPVYNRAINVSFKDLFRSGRTENLLIKDLAGIPLLLPCARADRQAGQKGHAEQRNGTKEIGTEIRRQLSETCTPIESHETHQLG